MDFIKFEVLPAIRDRVAHSLGPPSYIEYSQVDQNLGNKSLISETWNVKGWGIKRKQERFLEFAGNLPNYYMGLKGKQLTFSQIQESLFNLSKEFDLPLEFTRLRNIEINIDATLKYPVSKILPLVKFYRTNQISQTRTKCKYKGALEFQSISRFKLYDREWVHQRVPGNILRAESHFSKMQAVCAHQLSLIDLLSQDFVKDQHNRLIDRFKNVLIIEPMDKDLMTYNDQLLYQNWNDIQYLNQIMKDSSMKRRRERERLNNIQEKYGNSYHSSILQTLEDTSNMILST